MAKTKKKISGKSSIGMEAKMPAYKPTVYLDGKQIPKELASADIGKTVNLNVTAKIVRRTEEAKGSSSVSLELDSIGMVQPKKAKKK